jgi:hypothetical protein
MLKQALMSAAVAAAVSLAILAFVPLRGVEAPSRIDALAAQLAGNKLLAAKFAPTMLSYTMEPAEDAWMDGSHASGTDYRSLADASHSICYLTKMEIKGIQSPQDTNACRISVDSFTGFWQLGASVADGGHSQVRCNARCLVWKTGEEQTQGKDQ